MSELYRSEKECVRLVIVSVLVLRAPHTAIYHQTRTCRIVS